MSEDKNKTKKSDKGGHADSHAHASDHGEEEFVPVNSFYDIALSGLVLITALGIVGMIGIWSYLPLPELEEAPVIEGGTAKP
jgi:hypothetical protein